MSKIEFFALGGLDEHNKDCYALSINGDIFIINAGIVVPPSTSLGIKKMIPDSNWFEQNKRAIRGIFIGTPSYDRFGALEFFYPHIVNIPVYTSSVGTTILSTYLFKRTHRYGQLPMKLNIRIMDAMKSEKIGQTSVTPFHIFNSIPSSFGFVFHTPEGAIIYIDDFIMSSNKSSLFKDEIYEINKITNHKNLMLIVGVGHAGKNKGFTTPNHHIGVYFDNILIDAPGRTLVGVYDHDVYKVFSLIQAATKRGKPVNIFSNTFIELFKFILNKNWMDAKKIITLSDDKLDESKNVVIIVTGTPQRLFSKLEKIISDDEPKIHIKDDDTFIFAEDTMPGFEKLEANLFDDINRTNMSSVHKLPKNIMPVSASNEDHKFLVDILRPTYIVPVSGLYMNFIEYQKAVMQTGINRQNIIILENGQAISINNGIMEPKTKHITLEQQYIGTQGMLDVGASSMFERDQMKDNGVVLLSILFNKATKSIKKYNYDTVGVINVNDSNRAILNTIIEECNKQITTLMTTMIDKNQLNMKEVKISIRKIVDKQFEKKFNKKPLVLTTIIFEKDYTKK